MKQSNVFESTLKTQNGLYYLTMKTTSTPINTRLDIKNRTRDQSNDLTSDNDSNRSQMGHTQQRHLDLQQPRLSCETTQETTTRNIYTSQTMPSSSSQTGRLQANNSTMTRWNNKGFRGTASQLPANTGKENTGWTTMDRRNMVQSQT